MKMNAPKNEALMSRNTGQTNQDELSSETGVTDFHVSNAAGILDRIKTSYLRCVSHLVCMMLVKHERLLLIFD